MADVNTQTTNILDKKKEEAINFPLIVGNT